MRDRATIISDIEKMTTIIFVDGKKASINEFYNFSNQAWEKQISEMFFITSPNYIFPIEHANSSPFLSDIFNSPELYESMIEVLRRFDPDIISINADHSSNPYDKKIVYKILAKDNKEALPLSVYGDGMKKATLLMSAVVAQDLMNCCSPMIGRRNQSLTSVSLY